MSSLILKLSLALLLCSVLATVAHAQVSANPATNAPQMVEEGDKYAAEKQYDQAVEAYQQAIKLDATLASAYRGLARAYVNMGRSPDALAPMQTAVRLQPNDSYTHLDLGITLQNLRRFDEALVEINEAKRLSPRDAAVQNYLGNLFLNMGRTNDALAAYQEALRLNPAQTKYKYNSGLALMQLGRFADAIAPLQEALRSDPQHREARYLLSDAFGKLGRYDEAIDSWSKFLEIVPDGPEALTKRTWSYLYVGGHDREAAVDARRYLEVHGWRTDHSTFMAILANLSYRGAGMDEEAQATLEEGAAKVNANAWPYPIFRYLKSEISAEELLQAAIDNDKRTEAHAYMGLLQRIKGERDEARSNFEWVKKYGNKRYYEYPLAVEELRRMSR